MFCGNCGKPIAKGIMFCGECGSKVEQAGKPKKTKVTPAVQENKQPASDTSVQQMKTSDVQTVAPQLASVSEQPKKFAPKPKKSPNKAIIAVVAVLLVIGLGVGSFLLWNSLSESEEYPAFAQTENGNGETDISAVTDNIMPTDEEHPPTEIEDVPIFVLEMPGISEYGRSVAEEFLMQFPMMFATTFNHWMGGEIGVGEQRFFGVPMQYGYELDDGRFQAGWDDQWQPIIVNERRFQLGVVGSERITTDWGDWIATEPILTSEVPDFYLRRFRDSWERTGFYDRHGNRIFDEPWMLDTLYATNFSLWDFDRNGIPSIMIYYWGNNEGSGDGGAPASLFRYINGEFRRVSYFQHQVWQWGEPSDATPWWFPWQSYYFDDTGNLIGYFYGIVEPMPVYASIFFNNNLANKNVIARAEADWENFDWEGSEPMRFYWTNYLTREVGFESPIHIPWSENVSGERTIPRTNTNLIPLTSLDSLQEDISISTTHRLNVAGALDNWNPARIVSPVEQIPTQVASVFVGDILQFGVYSWRVLDVQDNRALLLTEQIIAHQPFHDREFNRIGRDSEWETSRLRHWLNNDFYNNFSSTERAQIASTTIINTDNPWFGWRGDGNNTIDKIFLLSFDEVVRYFGNSGMLAQGVDAELRSEYGSPQAIINEEGGFEGWEYGIFSLGFNDQYSEARVAQDANGQVWEWWLRSPGFNEILAGSINEHGHVMPWGRNVDMEVWGRGLHPGVRPAMWIYIK